MTIQWSDPIPHDGSDVCPAAARDVPCAVQDKWFGWVGHDYNRTGDFWQWESVTAYRIPITAPSIADELAEALENIIGEIIVPERNCSCHVSPPCGDCVNHSAMREFLVDARAVLAKYRGMKE